MNFGGKEHLAALRRLEQAAGRRHDFTLLWRDGSASVKSYEGSKAQAFARLRQALPGQVVRRGRWTSIFYNGERITDDERKLLGKIST